MSNVFEHLWSPVHRFASGNGEPSNEEDAALGFECANPSLQFEEWEPVPHAPATLHAPSSY